MVAAVRPESERVEVVDERKHDGRPVLQTIGCAGTGGATLRAWRQVDGG